MLTQLGSEYQPLVLLPIVVMPTKTKTTILANSSERGGCVDERGGCVDERDGCVDGCGSSALLL